MNKLLSITLAAIPVLAAVACTNTIIQKTPDPAATDPAATDPAATAPDAGIDAAPAVDPCPCPNMACKSKTDPTRMVCHPAKAPATEPDQQTIGKFQITGFEYWQWKKDDPYANEMGPAWGYNGDGQPDYGVKPTDQSRACMAEARAVLEKLLTKDVPPELEALRQKTVPLNAADKAVPIVNTFWQWNNDMTDAKPGVEVPDDYQGLWLYDKRLIKWMSHTERDGSCRLPTRESLVKFATGCLKSYPTCYESRY